MLDRMQVQYRETKTGFECIHLPSIDLTSVQPVTSSNKTASSNTRHLQQTSSSDSTSEADTMRRSRSLARKPSIMSLIRGKDTTPSKEPTSDRASVRKDHEGTNARPSVATNRSGDALATTPSGSSSFFNVVATHTDPAMEHLPAATTTEDGMTIASGITSGTHASTGVLTPVDETVTPRSRSPGVAKALPSIPRDFGTGNSTNGASGATVHAAAPLPTGQVDDEVFATIRKNSLSVRFEVNIVKVRWLFS